jgi:hypothetical protein
MNRLKLTLGVILVLLVGALAGALGTKIYYQQRIERFAPVKPPHRRKIFMMKRLSDRLDLTKEQQPEIEKIVEDFQSRISAVRREYLPKIEEITDQSLRSMEEKLRPEQKKKLTKLRKRLKKRQERAFLRTIQVKETPEALLARMNKRLNLTDEQAKEMRPILEEDIRERRKIIEKYQGRDRPSLISIKREMRELRRLTEERLARILTGLQYRAYLEMQKKEHRRFLPEERRPRPDRVN